MNIRLDESWRTALAPEFDKLYFSILTDRIRQAYQHEGPIYPPGGLIFRALDACPLPEVRVVILGQDPYHGAGQAEGLAFSVPAGVPIPPSLINIKKEIASDLGQPSIIPDGHLLPWRSRASSFSTPPSPSAPAWQRAIRASAGRPSPMPSSRRSTVAVTTSSSSSGEALPDAREV